MTLLDAFRKIIAFIVLTPLVAILILCVYLGSMYMKLLTLKKGLKHGKKVNPLWKQISSEAKANWR